MTVKNKSGLDKISIEDLIQEAAYQNSLRDIKLNSKERRKKVLDNYFKNANTINMFPSKYKMEKASQKFSKLFDYEK